MSTNPMKVGPEYTVSFLIDENVIGEVELVRVNELGTEMVVLRDSAKDGFLMFVMALEAVQALQMAERDPAWRAKLLTWKAIFEENREGRNSQAAPPDDVGDIPF